MLGRQQSDPENANVEVSICSSLIYSYDLVPQSVFLLLNKSISDLDNK